ncbi:hypothetical protein C2S52_000580 [Perilla frutescens var. hirtella]|nr:hypothetical protein C2S52_000580 [Perilla frutescens var. hirtella]
MLAISAGVAIAAYGETKYDSWRVLLQLGAVVFEATRNQISGLEFNFLIFGTNCVCICVEFGHVFAGGEDFSFDHECGWICEGLVIDCIFLVCDQG